MRKVVVLGAVALVGAIGLNASEMGAKFVDEMWNTKVVPKSEVCSNFNDKAGSTPSIALNNIPAKASKIVLAFSDETFQGMRDGGHGVLAYKIAKNTSSVTIPAVKGETFELPANVTSEIKHRGEKFGKKEGAYLAPCSGGKGNTYSVLIKAVGDDGETLSQTSLTLGTF